MSRKMRILLLVAEPWRNDDGGGNTINNFFEGMDAEFAQIYCNAALPKNNTCHRYFQISDGVVVKNFFNRKPVGMELSKESLDTTYDELLKNAKDDKKFIDKFRKIRLGCFITAKNFVWRYSNWKTDALDKFIMDFDPDVIYAPCYASPFELALTRYVKELTKKKVVTWIADDIYSLKRVSFSLFAWLNRFWNRACLRKTFPYYDVYYSISEDQIEEMSPIVGKQMKILRKGVEMHEFKEHITHEPIRMIYAGGIYINRWKTLAKIGCALRKINNEKTKMILNIYTQNTLTKTQRRKLDDGRNIFVHSAVSSDELKKIYSESDIAIHCESFALKNRLATRHSFSTKIIDCIASGCAIVVIAWKEHTGYKYLKSQDAAICIDSLKSIENVLTDIVAHPEIISEYAEKAYNCGIKNHNIKEIQDELLATLKTTAGWDS